MDFIRRDRAFYGFIAGYALVVAALAAAVGEADKFSPLIYLPIWLRCAFGVLAVGVAWLLLRSFRQPSPSAYVVAEVRRLASWPTLAGALLFTALMVFLGVFTSAKTLLTDLAPFSADRMLADLDAALHGGDPWRRLTGLNGVTAWIYDLYGTSWFIAITLFALAACVVPAWRAVRTQFVWSFLVCWSLLGNLVAGLFLSAGPIFYGRLLGDPRFDALVRHLRASKPAAMSYDDMLWRAHQLDVSGVGRGISAFPSMHVSMATLLMLTAWRLDRRFGMAMAGYLAFIQIGSVHTGWHYAVDGYASFALTVVIWKAVGVLGAVRARAGWAPSPGVEPAAT